MNDRHAMQLLHDRFHRDSLIALATTDGMTPSVRTVNAFYEDGTFYTVTYALSGKMKQIAQNPTVAVCGEWFTGHAFAEDLGHILLPKNQAIAEKLRGAFASWYDNGHTNESDPNTIILSLRLTDGVLFAGGERYELEF